MKDAQTLAVKRAEVEFHNFASLGEPERAIAAYAEENTRRAGLIIKYRDFIGPLSPFLEIGANAGHTSYLLANHFGAEGFALGPDGAVYLSNTAGDLVALEPKTLKPRGVYKAGQPLATAPVIFQHGEQAWIAAAAKDGSIHLVDAANMDKALAKSSPSNVQVNGLATWQDAAGTRWLLGSTASSVTAWKVTDRGGTPSFAIAWTSRDLASPIPPVIVNGVVLTASTGASPVLYALDGATGNPLWNSGNKIASAIRGGSLSVGNSQVFLGSNNGTLYVFGFPMEH